MVSGNYHRTYFRHLFTFIGYCTYLPVYFGGGYFELEKVDTAGNALLNTTVHVGGDCS